MTMNIDQDFDEDGNNIVPSPAENLYVASKHDPSCHKTYCSHPLTACSSICQCTCPASSAPEVEGAIAISPYTDAARRILMTIGFTQWKSDWVAAISQELQAAREAVIEEAIGVIRETEDWVPSFENGVTMVEDSANWFSFKNKILAALQKLKVKPPSSTEGEKV